MRCVLSWLSWHRINGKEYKVQSKLTRLFQTLEACKGKPGLGAYVVKLFGRGMEFIIPRPLHSYTNLSLQDSEDEGLLLKVRSESYELEDRAGKPRRPRPLLPFHRIWTKNVLCTLLAQAFFDFQMG